MRNRHIEGSLLIVATVLAGCSLAPTYERPAAPVPNAWPAGSQTSDSQTSALRQETSGDWQRYFPDPRLQRLIAATLENNRDLRIATARISEARAQYGVQRADRLPNLNLNASRNASLTPAGASVFTGTALHSQRYDVNISLVSFELDFWGRVSNLSAAAKSGYLATEAAQSAFRLSLISNVANAYLSTLELRERTALTAATVKARGEAREMIARRREVGVSSDLDYLQAEGAYQSSVAELANLERQLTAADNLLDLLVGQPVAEVQDLPLGHTLANQGITAGAVAGLRAEVLLKRPDVVAAEHRLMAANANIGAARAAFLPRIALTGSAGTASRTLNGLFDPGSDAWNFQPALTMPLFDAWRASSNVDLAQARKVVAVAEYERTIQQAFREVADLLGASEKLNQQLAAQEANAEAQRRRLVLVEARYKAGIANHLELLDAQRESFAAEQGALQVRGAWLGAATQLFKALAGEGSEPAQANAQAVTDQ